MELLFKLYDVKECVIVLSNIVKKLKEKFFNIFDLLGFKVICLCYIIKWVKFLLVIDSGCVWDEVKSIVDEDIFVDYVYKN